MIKFFSRKHKSKKKPPDDKTQPELPTISIQPELVEEKDEVDEIIEIKLSTRREDDTNQVIS